MKLNHIIFLIAIIMWFMGVCVTAYHICYLEGYENNVPTKGIRHNKVMVDINKKIIEKLENTIKDKDKIITILEQQIETYRKNEKENNKDK